MRSTLATLAVLLAGLVGCGSPAPPSTPGMTPTRGAPELVEPPAAFINGVAGQPVSWCWRGCADGSVEDPSTLPVIAPPFELEMPSGSRIVGVTAWDDQRPNPQPHYPAFASDAIGSLPESAVMLAVFVRFAGGGDAEYFWALPQS